MGQMSEKMKQKQEEREFKRVIEASKAESPFPLGWEQAVNPKGSIYYIDHNTRTTTWKDPRLNSRQKFGKGRLPAYDSSNFYNRVKEFLTEIRKHHYSDGRLEIVLHREAIFHDSMEGLFGLSAQDLYKNIFVKFSGEEGIDYGGMTREWFQCFSDTLIDENLGLLIRRNSYCFVTNPLCFQNPFYYEQFTFIGQMIGMAIYHQKILKLPFPDTFYKALLDQPITYIDLKEINKEVYNSIKYIENQENIEDLGLTFTITENIQNDQQLIEIMPDGLSILLNEENKQEYINLYTLYYLGLQPEIIAAIKEGISKVIPLESIAEFDYKELKEILMGNEEIDLNDLKENVIYDGYTYKSTVITYFWQVLDELDQENLPKFLHFATGCQKVPVGGFAHLHGSSGLQKFTIKTTTGIGLPTAHSCFNRIELPNYTSFEETKEKLLYAINETVGFGIE
jgi:hypothetical protein